MASKKAINWPAIKKRYLQGEKPKYIAADYDLTAKQVSNKAQADGWGSKKQQISANVEESVKTTLKAVQDLALECARKALEEYQSGKMSPGSRLIINTALKAAWPDKKTGDDIPQRIQVVIKRPGEPD